MFDVRSMHHIQRKIITDLARNSPLRFSELQPRNIPNNTFSYHLKKLLQMGYIELTDKGYVATRKALKTVSYVGAPERRGGRLATITMIYVTNDQGEVLVQKRTSRPFINWYGIPSGLIHIDESITQAAQRELYEKTGVLATTSSLKQHGVLDFRYYQGTTEDTFVHAVAFVYSYVYQKNDIAIDTMPMSSEWVSLDYDMHILPEVREIEAMIHQPGFSMRSVTFDEALM